ncbi:T-cell surface glycoprotein CD1a-like [Sceloporus undulatus]|uniref:T-cell surface glycoprotein CD1a-like n=1 Tax=Sceloporus undulatus TaxID=8520 RepID=UPI001C4C8C93|nr:T-cell surface glycoprotein CD1a-like [Sceloporus undulatus]
MTQILTSPSEHHDSVHHSTQWVTLRHTSGAPSTRCNAEEAPYSHKEPLALVFAQESSAATDSLLLVCRVLGFYPHQINISWLLDEKALPSSRINSIAILPNYNLTYQIQSSSTIRSADTSYISACSVQHSNLGKRSLVILWDHHNILAIVMISAVFLLGA